MPDLVLIPLPGVGTLSLTRDQYDAALIKLEPPTAAPAAEKPIQAAPTDNPPGPRALRYLRLPEVCQRVGLKKTSIYMLMSEARFPKPVKLTQSSVAWVEKEVEAYMAERLAQRDAAALNMKKAPGLSSAPRTIRNPTGSSFTASRRPSSHGKCERLSSASTLEDQLLAHQRRAPASDLIRNPKRTRNPGRLAAAVGEENADPPHYIRMREIMQRTGFDHATIYDLIRRQQFPKWADLPKRGSGWNRTEVDEWLKKR